MRRRSWLIPLLLLFAVTLPHLEQGDFGPDSARYAAVGLQAWRDPACFWTLHLQPDVPYFNKPPLALWLHGLVLHLFGVSLSTVRWPAILAAAGCVLFTVATARRLFGRATGFAAGVVLALSYEFFRRSREVSLDMWQLLFMLAALWCVVDAERRRAWWRLPVAGIPLGLALLCKPFMALLMVPVVAVWLIPAHGWKTLGWVAGMLLTASLVALPWHASMVLLHGQAFLDPYVGTQVVQRIQGETNPQPPWYYAVEMGRTYWPWMVPLVFGFAAWARRPPSAHRRPGLRLATVWLAIWALALTLFPDKRPRYELPLYPLLAWVAGYGMVCLPWRRLRTGYRRCLISAAAIVVAGAVAAACLPIPFQPPPDPNRESLLNWLNAHPRETVYAAALSTNDEGFFYLMTGQWLRGVRNSEGTLETHLDPGAAILYTAGLEPRPNPKEPVLFHTGPFTITRLEGRRWQPLLPSD